MYDFCMTLPYGGILLIGGIMGLMKGSVSSAVIGGGIGLALLAIGISSYNEFKENEQSFADDPKKMRFRSPTYAYTVVSFLLTLVVTGIMFDRYQESQEMMPAGYVTGLSAVALVFYAYKMVFSGDVGSNARREYKHND